MDEVPALLRRLWRLPSAGGRLGRRPELDVERVVRTAVGLADRDGLAGVTLAKVAKELGVTAMSLYRHVGSKDDLVVLMEDAADGAPPDLDLPEDDWRVGLRAWANALRDVHRRHPWLADVPFTGPPSGPNAIAWMDAGLRALRGTGLDEGDKVGVQMVLAGYVRRTSAAERQMAERLSGAGTDQAGVERDFGRALARFVDPDRFPDAARLFASGVFEHPPEGAPEDPADHDFAFGLELILDGTAAAVEAAAARR
ncbi:TetR/AcrR family transcriptional regulator [Nocardiopsis sp. RSe5-2]|uniref:TetR/AcrR family transcriptional regulator n=1 Tax=Nocardiopsis endophytica TaxID=3018445 RepID=A0ABT4U6I4_9ACTN|nr:TetR/AcrR family transcriptional regulator [Nocardiopsis endophytica]MDA2812543.1 TetR/AcrR family transcriptional regulator [Nocardiopsis endophytica]